MAYMNLFITKLLCIRRNKLLVLLLSLFLICFIGRTAITCTNQRYNSDNILELTDIYVTVPDQFPLSELSLYNEWNGQRWFVTTARINNDRVIHFAVSYHPETTRILCGDGIVDYRCEFDETTKVLRLYVGESGQITLCRDTAS